MTSWFRGLHRAKGGEQNSRLILIFNLILLHYSWFMLFHVHLTSFSNARIWLISRCLAICKWRGGVDKTHYFTFLIAACEKQQTLRGHKLGCLGGRGLSGEHMPHLKLAAAAELCPPNLPPSVTMWKRPSWAQGLEFSREAEKLIFMWNLAIYMWNLTILKYRKLLKATLHWPKKTSTSVSHIWPMDRQFETSTLNVRSKNCHG